MGIWMVQGCKGMGDIPGIQGGAGRLCMFQVTRLDLTQELRPKV